MSEVISFRLDSRNPREAQALKALADHQERGYSVRHILTEALLRLEPAEAGHDMHEQMTAIRSAIDRISDQVERLLPSDGQFIGRPETPSSALSDAFVLSVKSVARPGLAFEG